MTARKWHLIWFQRIIQKLVLLIKIKTLSRIDFCLVISVFSELYDDCKNCKYCIVNDSLYCWYIKTKYKIYIKKLK